MDLLVARTGLTLNPGQMADLVLAWRQLAVLIATIPQTSTLADDQAYVFRLPGPEAAPPPPAISSEKRVSAVKTRTIKQKPSVKSARAK